MDNKTIVQKYDSILKDILILATDCDGCLTDGKLYIGNDGELFKVFSVKDGQGVRLIQAKGLIPAVITTRQSKILENRAKELDIVEIYQKVTDKKATLELLAQKYDVSLSQIAYIGDDLNDLDALKHSGISFAPSDCAEEIKPFVHIVLKEMGGEGVFRSAAALILASREQTDVEAGMSGRFN